MADVIDNEPENEEPENEEEGEEEDAGPDTLVQAWETANEAVSWELHSAEGEDEVLVVEEAEDDEEEPTEHIAMVAQSVEDLDEVIEILQEIRAKMVARAAERKG